MTYRYTLDPSLFIWDEVNYDSLKAQYFEISYFLMDAIPILEDFPIFITGELITEFINRFPLYHIADHEDLRDLQNALYSFLSKLLENSPPDPQGIEGAKHHPPLFCIGKNAGLDNSITQLFCCALDCRDDLIFVTHYNLWNKSYTSLTFGTDEREAKIDVVADRFCLEKSKELFGRIFQQIRKHMKGGWGSVLDLDDERASQLLTTAIRTLHNSEALVNHYLNDRDEVIYVVFHNHFRNFYHGYPDPEAPQKFTQRLLDMLPPATR